MGHGVIDNQYDELIRLTELLKRMVDSYRLLIGGAAELNSIYPRKKSDVEEALDRVDELGEIIDNLIDVIGKYGENYISYSKVKNKVVCTSYEKKKYENIIQTEINNELNFQNEREKEEK